MTATQNELLLWKRLKLPNTCSVTKYADLKKLLPHGNAICLLSFSEQIPKCFCMVYHISDTKPLSYGFALIYKRITPTSLIISVTDFPGGAKLTGGGGGGGGGGGNPRGGAMGVDNWGGGGGIEGMFGTTGAFCGITSGGFPTTGTTKLWWLFIMYLLQPYITQYIYDKNLCRYWWI